MSENNKPPSSLANKLSQQILAESGPAKSPALEIAKKRNGGGEAEPESGYAGGDASAKKRSRSQASPEVVHVVPSPWRELRVSLSGVKYYHHPELNVVTWECPTTPSAEGLVTHPVVVQEGKRTTRVPGPPPPLVPPESLSRGGKDATPGSGNNKPKIKSKPKWQTLNGRFPEGVKFKPSFPPTENAGDEAVVLATDPRLSAYASPEEQEEGERTCYRLTEFSIYTREGWLVSLDSGLMERDVELYASGVIKPIYDEDPAPLDFPPCIKLGPLVSWAIEGYAEGGDRAYISICTPYADYKLLGLCAEQYRPFIASLNEKATLTKLVVEWLQDNYRDQGPENLTYEKLLAHLSGIVPSSAEATPYTEDMLLTHMTHILNHVWDLDQWARSEETTTTTEEEDDAWGDVRLFDCAAIKYLVQLEGRGRARAKSERRHVRRTGASNDAQSFRERHAGIKATVTPVVESVFAEYFSRELENVKRVKDDSWIGYLKPCDGKVVFVKGRAAMGEERTGEEEEEKEITLYGVLQFTGEGVPTVLAFTALSEAMIPLRDGSDAAERLALMKEGENATRHSLAQFEHVSGSRLKKAGESIRFAETKETLYKTAERAGWVREKENAADNGKKAVGGAGGGEEEPDDDLEEDEEDNELAANAAKKTRKRGGGRGDGNAATSSSSSSTTSSGTDAKKVAADHPAPSIVQPPRDFFRTRFLPAMKKAGVKPLTGGVIVQFVGEPSCRSKTREFFREVRLNKTTTLRLGDYVLVDPASQQASDAAGIKDDEDLWVVKVNLLFQQGENARLNGLRFAHGLATVLGKAASEGELFAVDQCVTMDLGTAVVAKLLCVHEDVPKDWASRGNVPTEVVEEERRARLMKAAAAGGFPYGKPVSEEEEKEGNSNSTAALHHFHSEMNVFHWKLQYEPRFSRFTYPLRPRPEDMIGFCLECDRRLAEGKIDDAAYFEALKDHFTARKEAQEVRAMPTKGGSLPDAARFKGQEIRIGMGVLVDYDCFKLRGDASMRAAEAKRAEAELAAQALRRAQPELFTEIWRKPEGRKPKGSHDDTRPFRVGVVVGIIPDMAAEVKRRKDLLKAKRARRGVDPPETPPAAKKNEDEDEMFEPGNSNVGLRLRKLYRPEDTHMGEETGFTFSERELFWSGNEDNNNNDNNGGENEEDEIVLPIEEVAEVCAAVHLSPTATLESLGPLALDNSRAFFVRKVYKFAGKSFSILPRDVEARFNRFRAASTSMASGTASSSSSKRRDVADASRGNEENEDDDDDGHHDQENASPSSSSSSSSSSDGNTAIGEARPPNFEPLALLDIFAGCGGLSLGLEQAGVCVSKWAIEFEPPAAKSFQDNHPDAAVYCEDCNKILRCALEGADTLPNGQRIPTRGEVKALVGGPPCQGFSGMNRFNSRQYSRFKNSLVATYLSYCDFYRPRLFLLENVKNFAMFHQGIVAQMCIRALVEMGYQVTMGCLQAGSFGVPQTRRRFIIVAAAPGDELPRYPEPTHTFTRVGMQINVNMNGYVVCPIENADGAAPYRRITVHDAISDLPAIQLGESRESIPYDREPTTDFQRRMRAGAGPTVTQHICKKFSPLVLARFERIPPVRGSDWRDLPNDVVPLSNGGTTVKLEYPDRKPGGGNGTNTDKKDDNGGVGDEPQENTLIPWCLPHTANRHNQWSGLYGRLDWTGYFGTTVTNPEPMGKQGVVVHPTQHRVVSVRECARSQGFPDIHKLAGNILDRHRQVGNAVPPPMARAIGMEWRRALEASAKLFAWQTSGGETENERMGE